MDKAYQYTSPAFWVTANSCPIKTVNECVYQTTGDVVCTGTITSGANNKASTDKVSASPNERLLNIILDAKVWK